MRVLMTGKVITVVSAILAGAAILVGVFLAGGATGSHDRFSHLWVSIVLFLSAVILLMVGWVARRLEHQDELRGADHEALADMVSQDITKTFNQFRPVLAAAERTVERLEKAVIALEKLPPNTARLPQRWQGGEQR